MSWCTRSDVEDVFGVNNVAKWAKLEDTDTAAMVTARIARGIAVATDHAQNVLRNGPYLIADLTAAMPAILTDAVAKLTGVWLYENRGIEDFDPESGRAVHKLVWHQRTASRVLRAIKFGTVTLAVTIQGETIPVIHSFED